MSEVLGWFVGFADAPRGERLDLVVVDAEMRDDDWPYLRIRGDRHRLVGTIGWTALKAIARRVEDLEVRDALPPPRRKRKAVTR
jgi:hypothetical protein